VNEAALRAAIAGELRSNLLPFWRERGPDPTHGGFIAEMSHDGVVRPSAPRGLVLNARLLWTFSALYRRLGEACDLALARRAFRVLEEHFADREHGGYRWRVDAGGRPLDGVKKTYGQAFCIYALAEHHLATGDVEPLAAAQRLWECLERRAREERHGGYPEARAADWSPTAELRLGDGDMVAPRSMNAHLHLLEAFSTLYRAWPEPAVAARLRELIELLGGRILARDGADRGHLRHFFDEAWRPLSSGYTYGHDIEAAWLLAEAARTVGGAALAATVRRWSAELATAVLGEGLDPEGALAYAGWGGAVTDGTRDWWCQAEAVVGLWDAWEATGDPRFARAAAGVWAFIARAMSDRAHGEWHWRVNADGTVDASLPRVSEWKCPYHTVRMCLEMLRRLGGAGGAER